MRYTLLLLTLGVVAAGDLPSNRIWTLENIVWQRVDPDGTKYAVLDGDRDRAGAPFTYAFWMPGGVWVKPHTHTQQAHVVVVKGSLRLGYGARMDRSKAVEMKAGTLFIVRAGEAHYEGSDGECLIIGTALGEWKTKELE
jgi:mannose-6-phosphate isomerase-like protein (cupin superfamily)